MKCNFEEEKLVSLLSPVLAPGSVSAVVKSDLGQSPGKTLRQRRENEGCLLEEGHSSRIFLNLSAAEVELRLNLEMMVSKTHRATVLSVFKHVQSPPNYFLVSSVRSP